MKAIRKQFKDDELKFRREPCVSELYGEIWKMVKEGSRTPRQGRDNRVDDFYDSDSGSEGERGGRRGDQGGYRDKPRNDRAPSPGPRNVRFSGLPLSFTRRQDSDSSPSTATHSALSSKSRSGTGSGTEDSGQRSSSLPDDFLNNFCRLVVSTTTMSQELMSMKQDSARLQRPTSFYGGNIQEPQQMQPGGQNCCLGGRPSVTRRGARPEGLIGFKAMD
ncbi:BQ5605_C006g03959 [Microbotryum silenes-dioicae]|uniref:BQ5605_C006g03959 protein n=1 Tax=Microbotryum silenes-dioicae TaxID=796604 RepID=A0A2X0M5I3_9BASI|nr:BQ5605_C006g03959 [Microbotryum silenes-dioicae]